MQKKRILIVDDEATNREIMEESLAEEDLELRTVQSGEEALEAIDKFNPDLILLDIMMPGLSGYDVCQKVKANNSTKYIKVIFISAKGMIDERLKGYELGADDYLIKPFDVEELLAKVKVFLRLKYVEETDALRNNVLNMADENKIPFIHKMLEFGRSLQEDASLSREYQENMRRIMDYCMQLWEFTKKTQLMCDLKRKEELNMAPCSMIQLLNDTIKDLESVATLKKISIHFELKCDEGLSLDAWFIRKALHYILENAIEMSPSDGEVTIVTQRKHDQYTIEVSDQGARFNQAAKDALFDEFTFFYGGDEISRGGLGLAIARSIAILHGGTLDAKNLESGGVSLIFKLP